ncbi:DUF2121 domain-containing protein [uncultured Methanobrevibacter sp.]|uniref:MJ0548 connectase family domain-containing protein n=1 Tax=uncultured Methanobrevibacter sp. TaxID=253161 RepID=UPI0025D6BD0D|nr:DUF2121 domain-containing protein [uncultured Methanobrevibacter sp.]
MSIIIAYIGKKGCVMASDKRRIAYFGNKNEREELESKLYSGNIRNDEELYKEAAKRDLTLKITDDTHKIKKIGTAVMGEVSTKTTMEVKRKRIYGTTNGYQIIELVGSTLKSKDKGASGIIIFGNKIAKSIANPLVKERWKSNISLKYMGDIFEEIIKEIADKTPSVGKEVDVLIGKDDSLTPTTAQEYLDKTEDRDKRLLEKYRNQLTEELDKANESMEITSKLINEGNIGRISNINGKILNVVLENNVEAYDTNWKLLSKPNEEVIMLLNKDNDGNIIDEDNVSNFVSIDDKVIIKDGNLCIEKNNISLNCNIVLCNTK